MKRVVLTGGKGFIGGHLRQHLLSSGYEVIALGREDVDLRDPAETARALEGTGAHIAIHLASCVSPGRPRNFSLRDFFENEVLLAENVAKGLPSSTEFVAFFGSCEEYGNGPVPFREDQPPVSFSPYGWSKIASYFATSLICRERGLRWCWLRPFLTFGEGQDNQLLVPSLIRGCLNSAAVELTKGEQTRDLVYIHDLCKMVLRILQAPERAEGHIINLCSGEERRIRDIGELIRARIGRGELRWGSLPYRPQEAMHFYGDKSKFARLFGEPELTPFEEAIARTIASH